MILVSLLIGIVAGSRTMTAPAMVSWAAWLGSVGLAGTWAGFLASGWAVLIFTMLALVEFVTDQLPTTPSRKVPVQFGTRIVMGALTGAALGTASGAMAIGLVAGVLGAVIGTLGGAALRQTLAARFGSDRPAAATEDALAVLLGLVAVAAA